MRKWSVLLTVVLAGCGPDSSVPESAGGGTAVAEGTVRQVGSAPVATTRIETEDGPVVVVGPLALELARASGAVARVHGSASGSGGPDTIRAVKYELVSVDGLSPLVGVLGLTDGRLTVATEYGQRVGLDGASDRMRSAVGSKIWVTTSDDGRSVVRWGILRQREN
jgi:hypothetical protein